MNTGFTTPIAIGTGIVALLAVLPIFADGYALSLAACRTEVSDVG
jgi:hypothetical protein